MTHRQGRMLEDSYKHLWVRPGVIAPPFAPPQIYKHLWVRPGVIALQAPVG